MQLGYQQGKQRTLNCAENPWFYGTHRQSASRREVSECIGTGDEVWIGNLGDCQGSVMRGSHDGVKVHVITLNMVDQIACLIPHGFDHFKHWQWNEGSSMTHSYSLLGLFALCCYIAEMAEGLNYLLLMWCQ